MPPDNASRRREFALAAVVVVALLLVAVGAGAHGSARIKLHDGSDLAVVAVALVALALVGGAVATFNGRRLRRQAANAVAGVLVLGAVGALGWLLLDMVPGRPPTTARSGGGGPVTGSLGPLGRSGAGRHSPALAPVPVAAGSLVVVLLVVAVVLALLARRRGRSAEAIDHDEAARGAVYAAATAGADAMRDVLDPRAAIIACYAAMEHVLAGAGVRRLVAETPADLLTRAVDLNIAPAAARRLTELFLEARYSTHAMTEADRDAARNALSLLQAPRQPAASGVGGAGEGQG